MKVNEYSHASVDHPERNEDADLIFTGDGTTAPVFVVIDGMGGHQHVNSDGQVMTGRDAAQMVRSVLIEDLIRLPIGVSAETGGEAEQKVIAAIERANQRIYTELNRGELPTNQRIGAVATVAIVCENGKRLLVGQVGDTRAYLFTAGDLIQLCQDEDNITYLVEQGAMSDEDGQRIAHILNTFDGIHEPATSGHVTIAGQLYEMYLAWRWFLAGNPALNIPGANAVITSLGVHSEAPQIQISRIEVAAGDRLFMCSDGLYKNLTEAEIIQFLRGQESAGKSGAAALARSQDTLNRRSTQDDITALCVVF